MITASVSNMGLASADNVKIRFFAGSPSEKALLGEQIVSIPSGETARVSVQSSLPDGFYTFYVTADPDNKMGNAIMNITQKQKNNADFIS
ncbi:MAG: CARDB domain-containing protein [Candidatus Methanofastidiosia archaeon]